MKTQIASSKAVLIDHLSAPLDGVTTAKVDINSGLGNLTIDGLNEDEQALASGTLQYLESQDLPIRTLECINGHANLTIRGSSPGRAWLRLPWKASNGATEWQIHLNPTVSLDITAHSGGGNLKLNLAGMAITHLSADTGAGNIHLVLSDKATNLLMTAKTGAGNVDVQVPGDIKIKIHASSGLGQVIVDAHFNRIDNNTYQSPGYDDAVNKLEITATTGVGNVNIRS